MEPLSITFLVIGIVIIVVNICRYVHQKFFHRVEERHEEGAVIDDEELVVDNNNVTQLVYLNREQDLIPNFSQISEFGVSNQIDGKNIASSIINNSSLVEENALPTMEPSSPRVNKLHAKWVHDKVYPIDCAIPRRVSFDLSMGTNYHEMPPPSLTISQREFRGHGANPSYHDNGAISCGASPANCSPISPRKSCLHISSHSNPVDSGVSLTYTPPISPLKVSSTPKVHSKLSIGSEIVESSVDDANIQGDNMDFVESLM